MRVSAIQVNISSSSLKLHTISYKALKININTSSYFHSFIGGPLWKWVKIKVGNKVQRRAMLIGVVSRGVGCGREQYPGIYTRITQYLSWIYDYVKKSGRCSGSKNMPSAKKKINSRNSRRTLIRRIRNKKLDKIQGKVNTKKRQTLYNSPTKQDEITEKINPHRWIPINKNRKVKVFLEKKSSQENEFHISKFRL